MPQTILTFAALILVSGLVLNLNRSSAWSAQHQEVREIEIAAIGLSSEVFSLLESRSFDERTTPSAIASVWSGTTPTAASAFSMPAKFGATDRGSAGCNLLRPSRTPECDDIDDVSSTSWMPLSVTLAPGRVLAFTARLQVFYVTSPESMVSSPTPTLLKRVTLDIRFANSAAAINSDVYRTTRVYMYDPVKARTEYQASAFYSAS